LNGFVPDDCLAPPGDEAALAEVARARFGDARAGERALAAARERCAPEAVVPALEAVYGG
jgi:hypothetical protein